MNRQASSSSRKFFSVLLSLGMLLAAETLGQAFYFARHFPKTYSQNYQPKTFTRFSIYGVYDYIPGVPVDLRGIGYPLNYLGVDQYGFVHNGYDRPLKEEDEIVLLLGGSTVEGRGASSNRNTIAATLERMLQGKFPGRPIRVLNGGRAGYFSYQELAFLAGKIPQLLKPRAVISLNGRNDADLPAGYADFGWKPNWKPYFDTLTRDVNRRILQVAHPLLEFREWLIAHSIIAGTLSRILRPAPPVSFYAPQEKSPRPEILSRAARAYLANHAVAHAAARTLGASYYAFLQPILLESQKPLTPEEKKIQEEWGKHYKGPFFWPALEIFYAEVLRQAGGMDFFHDLSRIFQKVPGKVYWDNCHYTDYGNELIARQILAEIVKDF